VSTDGSTWSDIDEASSSINHGAVAQLYGSTHVLAGDYKVIVPSGKKDEVVSTVTSLWTPTSGEPWAILFAIWETAGASEIYLRFSPEGGGSGALQYTTADQTGAAAAATISELSYPEAVAGGDLLKFTFKIVTSQYLEATVGA
jgi:hypothetical protein